MEYGPEPPLHHMQQQQQQQQHHQQANGVASPGCGMQQPEVLPVFGPQQQPSPQQQQLPANRWSTHQQQQTPGRSPVGAGFGPAQQQQQAWPQQRQQASAAMQPGQCPTASPCSAAAVAPAASAGDGVFAIAGSGGSGGMFDPFAAAAGWSFLGAPPGAGTAAAAGAAGGGSLFGPAGGVCSMFRDNSVSSPPTEQLQHGQAQQLAGSLGGAAANDGALLAALRRQLQAEGVGASGEMPLSAAPTLSSNFSM
jgi:hypothetical protein